MKTNLNERRVNVCYCGNGMVFPLILLSVLSITKYTSCDVTVYILTMDLSEKDKRFTPITASQLHILKEAITIKNVSNDVVLLDMREAYLRCLDRGKNSKNHYTPYAQGRLLLSEFELPERVLYIDSDVMCCSDLSQILEVDIENYEFAAVLDHMGKFWIKRDYCNSGVMLLNMETVKRTNLLARARELVNTKRLVFPDQTALNRLVKYKLVLPRKFNEQRAICEDTVLKHFCKGIKWLPFFKVYNYKQSDVKSVRNKLHINQFDDVYGQYNLLARKYGFVTLDC